ncbi:MAG: hypothetical protein II979_08025, partial [Clostridia bacterium]|nr:hypothetical protein [Clostridia bacterium]
KVVSLVSAVLVVVLAVLLKNGIYLPYEESFDGYMLVMEWEDRINEEYPTPVHTEPVSLQLAGEKHYHILQGVSFIGDIRIDGFSQYTFGNSGWYSCRNGLFTFGYYHPRDRHKGYTDSILRGVNGPLDLRNRQGDSVMLVETLRDTETFCMLVNIEDPQYTYADGYMIFPAASAEEALDWYHTELQAAWDRAYEYYLEQNPSETDETT